MLQAMFVSVLAAVIAASAPGTPGLAQARGKALAPELNGLGTIHMPVTTSVPRAQRFFDQGVRLVYAFNHQEARRAFREAARLDPSLAMAYWGEAMTLGPTPNSPMAPEHIAPAMEAIAHAKQRAARASARDRALIDALSSSRRRRRDCS